VTVPRVVLGDLSTESIDWGIAQHKKRFRPAADWADRSEFLSQTRLVVPYLPDEEYLPEYQPCLAALLLFGKPSAIERNVPFFETIVQTESERLIIRKNIIDTVRDLCLGEGSILRSRLPQISENVLKELIVNAFIHRCYRTPAPVIVSIGGWGFEVRSPGELLTGLSVSNLIHGVPVYRNLLLADGARFVGLCDKIGQGIDLIFKGVLSSGLGLPEFESGNNLFTARIPLSGSAEFKEFLRKRSQTLNQLDEIIALRVLWSKDSATLNDLCSKMQRKPDLVERVLGEMTQKGMIEQEGLCYRLCASVRRDIETIFQSDQLTLDSGMWGDPTQ
jgi:predicted HTH transcriptional regulator